MIPKKKHISKDSKTIKLQAFHNLLILQDFYEDIGNQVMRYLSQKRNKNVRIGEMICNINLDEDCN